MCRRWKRPLRSRWLGWPGRMAVLGTLVLAGCGKPAGDPQAAHAAGAAASAPAAATSLLVAPEDLFTVALGAQAFGPVILGSLQPERRADLRAEIPAVVLQVLKDNGEPVRRGDLLLRLDDSTIRESLNSADESLRAASRALEQAERQVQRLKTLQAQGMTTLQSLEDAELRRNNAQSDRLAAQARVSTARQQLARTEVRAPFDGVVSERKASAGDTAQVGKELVKVIDPRSMRFEGLVSADRMHELKIGLPVRFRVNGYPQTEFSGKVQRIDAVAHAGTRQVAVVVAIAGEAPRVAGLYAEGRIESGNAQVLLLPESALVRSGDQVHVWRLRQGVVQKQAVQAGSRDERSGRVVVNAGLAPGDLLLRRPTGVLVDGQAFEFAALQPPAAASVPAAAGARPAAAGK